MKENLTLDFDYETEIIPVKITPSVLRKLGGVALGKSTSMEKQMASRRNGKMGGRPRKKVSEE